MKKQVLFLCVFMMCIHFSFSKLNAQSGGNWPPIDEATEFELDCIARKHLGSANTPDLELSSVKKGYAGYYVKYNKVKDAIRVFGAETTVILRDNLSLNVLYPDALDTRLITQSPVIAFTQQNAEGRLLTTRPDILSVQSTGTYWIKPEGDWLVAYGFLAYIPTQQNHDLFFVDAGDLDIYEKDGEDYVKILGRPAGNDHEAEPAYKQKMEVMMEDENYYYSPPGEIHGSGTAKVYKRFPTGLYDPNSQDLENIDVDYVQIGNIKYMERGSVMKYVPEGDNDLVSSDGELFDYVFTYNIYTPENLKYLKAFAWTKMRTIHGVKEVYMDVLNGEDNFLGYNIMGNKKNLTFGGSPGHERPLASDEFWISAASIFMDHIDNNPSVGMVSGTNFYNGYLHYLAQDKLLKIGSDGICNYFGGVSSTTPSYRSDVKGCLVNNIVLNQLTRDAITTLFAEIHQHAGLGPDILEKIMSDMLENRTESFAYKDEDLYNFIYDIFETAKEIRNNNQMTSEQLCALREKINLYFQACSINQTVLYESITDVISDLMIGDWTEDIGHEPHTFTTLYVSPNIYNFYDGIFSNEPVIGVENNIFVNVKNIGCDIGESQTLKVYWAFANMGFGWPAGWNKMDTEPVVSLDGGQNLAYVIPWTPVDPGTDNFKVCILARLTNGEEDKAIKANGEIFNETGVIGDNIRYNNGIALRNMTLVKKPGIVGDPQDERIYSVIIQDPEPPSYDPNDPNNPPVLDSTEMDITIIINLPPPPTGDPVPHVIDVNNPDHYDPDGPSGPDTPPFNNGNNGGGSNQGATPDILCEREAGPIYISDPDFFTKGEIWMNIKKLGTETWGILLMQGTGFTTGMDGWIKITSPEFRLESLPLIRGVQYVVGMKYKALIDFEPSSFNLVLKESATQKTISGEVFVIKQDESSANKPTSSNDAANAKNSVTLRPNPASEILEIVSGHQANFKRIEIYDISGRKVYHHDVTSGGKKHEVLIQSWNKGVYSVKCVFDDLSDQNLPFVKN